MGNENGEWKWGMKMMEDILDKVTEAMATVSVHWRQRVYVFGFLYNQNPDNLNSLHSIFYINQYSPIII